MNNKNRKRKRKKYCNPVQTIYLQVHLLVVKLSYLFEMLFDLLVWYFIHICDD